MIIKARITFINGKTMEIQDEAKNFRSFARTLCRTQWRIFGDKAFNAETICTIEEVTE